MPDAHFSPALFRFLEELAAHNDREWFHANRDRYESDLREPALRFIMDFGPRLDAISPHFRADPRKQGGSLFRIHRDVRFSKDKSPYKTHTGIQFRHTAGKDAHAPGFYLHLEPAQVFLGIGIWHPDGPTLRAIREAIVDDARGWTKAKGPPFGGAFELAGDTLSRAPSGFDKEHPLVDDLRRKDFIGVASLSEKDVTTPGFLDDFTARCRSGAGFIRWLCGAVGVAF
ncbi:MAG TPA: DUF2461 domain-containing protein [Longimicrobiales bacterium]|jgi:uncharacterized protein (TIGR02453 family)